jgi:hypothetical protein
MAGGGLHTPMRMLDFPVILGVKIKKDPLPAMERRKILALAMMK